MAKAIQVIEASKSLNELTYITYKRYVETKFQGLIIPSEVIPRSKVEMDKQNFATAFMEASCESDHVVGSQLQERITLTDGEYMKANAWGKCAKRMGIIIKKLQPNMFYDNTARQTQISSRHVANPFLLHVQVVSNDNSSATSSSPPQVSQLPSVQQVNGMLKPALVRLYASIMGDNSGSKLTVAQLKLHIQEKLQSQRVDTVDNAAALLPTGASPTNAPNTVISPPATARSDGDIELMRVKHSAHVLSRMLYQIIENTVDYVDLTAILSKYNIDMGLFVNNNNTEVHAYYRARMLHAAILAELLPNGHDGVRQKFASIQQLAKVTTDSFTQLNILRYELNRIKTEISLTVNNEQYPNYMWIDAFIERIQCPQYSKTMNAIESTMVEHSTTPLDFNEFMHKVIKYVEVTTNININHVAMGPDYRQQAITNDRIQVAQTKDQSTKDKCTFCTVIRKKYPQLKGMFHPTEECRRKTWVCWHCDQIMDDPKTFHLPTDCPKKELASTGKRARDKEQRFNRKRSGQIIRDPDDNNSTKKLKYNSRKVMVMQNSDDEWDSDTSDPQQITPLSTVKLNKQANYYAPFPIPHLPTSPMIIDSGANQCTLPPEIANKVKYPKKHDTLHITGIGQLRLTADQAVTIHDIDHYIIEMDEGIISISKLCQKFDIKAIFSKTDVKFTNNEMSHTYATGNLTNGLYVIAFDQYTKLLQQLASCEVMRINAAKTTVISNKCEAYIKKLHCYMGHASSMKMTDTIRSGITLPNPDNYDGKLHNTELLCKMITKYYTKRTCIACKIILHRTLLHQPNITIYPTIPFEEITFDYKPSDIVSYDKNRGTFIAACMATTYAIQFPVKSSKHTLQALTYFIQVANSFGFKILRVRYDAASSNDSAPIQEYLNTRGINGVPVSVGRQCRNFVEKIIDKIFKTYNVIQASQCLLNITYWPRGLDTAISYNNMRTNSRCVDITPHEAVTKSKPRIQQYSYGQPVLINRQQKHYHKNVEYRHQNIMAIVIQIDNTVLYGVKVITCITGTIAHGYYDMLGTIDFDMYDASQRKEVQQRYTIASTQDDKVIQQLPMIDNTFRFMDMDNMIHDNNQYHQITPVEQITPVGALISDPTTIDEGQAQHTATNIPQSDIQTDQIMHLGQAEILNKITPHLQIHSQNDTVVLQDEQYALLTEHEKKPQWHKVRHLKHHQQWVNVARDEIEKLDANNVGEVVQRIDVPTGIQIIPTTLVLTYKKILQDDGTWGYKPRARLAGRGDLEHSTNDEECYAPTTYISTILTLLAIAVQDNWIVATFDVIGAFLKTPTSSSEQLYISLPGDILPKAKVIRLHKYLYGLKKANNKFNEHFHHILIAFGLQATITDICLYHNADIRVAIFVDDGLIIARNSHIRDKLLGYLDACIGIESHLEPKQYLKLELIISPRKILIHQRNYIEHMHIAPPNYVNLHNYMSVKYNSKYPIPNTYEEMRLEYIQSTHCTYVTPKLVQEIVGTLIYVIYSTRGELQICGHYLSKYQSAPTEFDMFMAYNTYLYLKAHPYEPLVYSNANKFTLSLISDGAHMKNIDVSVRGQLGWFLVLGNCTLMVESKAAARPTRSATETEVQAGGNGLSQVTYMLTMLHELNVPVEGVHYYTDCLSAIKLINRRQQLSKKARHFANEIAQFKFAVFGIMQLQLFFTPTGLMSADLLTKLKILGAKKKKFAADILNPSLFFQSYQQHINTTNKLFKKVRFCNGNTSGNAELEDFDIVYDDDAYYVNEVYNQ